MLFESNLELFIIQPTTFCNINCRYCYLPERGKKKLMNETTLVNTFTKLFNSQFISKEFTIVWHAGEPLVAPISFYEKAIRLIDKLNKNGHIITHNIQTNGTLINDDWCKFFNKNKIKIGVSIDGPEFLHDSNRLKRNGNGTFNEVMKGIDLLKKHNISFHTISVITSDTIKYPNEFFDFFEQLGVRRVALNIEETEGVNLNNSMSKEEQNKVLRTFVKTLFDRWMTSKMKPHIREFEGLFGTFSRWNGLNIKSNQDATPFRIINVDADGYFTTFSPEIIGHETKYGKFIFGNVNENDYKDAIENEVFKNSYADILSGISKCKETCYYYNLCGGGSPSNKYFENGTFDSCESWHCKNGKQVYIDEVLAAFEEKMGFTNTN